MDRITECVVSMFQVETTLVETSLDLVLGTFEISLHSSLPVESDCEARVPDLSDLEVSIAEIPEADFTHER